MSRAPHVPDSLRPPVRVMLARAVDRLPDPSVATRYEMKWDGFRAVLVRDGDATTVWSRNEKNLTASFPDIAAAASEQVRPGTVLDGELVAWVNGRLDFAALSARLNTGAAKRLARTQPVNFVAFDILATDGMDVRELVWNQRREVLELLDETWNPPLSISPVTDDPTVAQRWMHGLARVGIEGLVIKDSQQPYRPGRREWLKFKTRTTIEVICAAVIGPPTHPQVVVAGLPTAEGRLRIVGRTGLLTPTQSQRLTRHLRPPQGEHPWPSRVSPGVFGRFDRERRVTPVDLTLVEPFVIEVAADTARTGDNFRHQLRLVRARPDLRPEDVEA